MNAIRSWVTLKQSDKDVSSGLETDDEYRERWITIRVVYFSGFLTFLSFGIVSTGLWPYLNSLDPSASKEFLGIIFSAPALGQLLVSPFVGWWTNKLPSVRVPYVLLTAVFICGNVLYAVIEIFAQHRKYMVLLSRFLVGIATCVNTISRAYISSATKVPERTRAISMNSFAQTLGLAAGPILQSVLSDLGERGHIFCGLRINMYTAGGWICVLMGFISLLLFYPSIFKHRSIAAKEAMKLTGSATAKESWNPLDHFAIWITLVGFGALMYFYVSLQTLLSPLALDQFAWNREESLYYLGMLMTVGTTSSCAIFLLLNPLCKRFSEQNVLIFGAILPLFLSQVFMLPIGDTPIPISQSVNGTAVSLGCPATQEWCHRIPAVSKLQLTLAYTMVSVSFAVGSTMSQSILSKLLGSRPQGNWMALFTSVGGVTRVVGPGCVLFYVRYGTQWTFGAGALISGLIFCWMGMFKERLRILPVKRPAESVELKLVEG